ncbi:ankyrin repeat and KH domain-containing protein 1 [Colletotrichum liriopes]|uniref:Ankyrin repeat and KH domain-containing protein 1 n=1 Tax=Colletotrichum liriopes TaxID=708192 RepID=A0AA37LXX0_9PEZI|nr:ankyrin repeat and KH domain-containing protein 1 [Colletotrichum liriopes]
MSRPRTPRPVFWLTIAAETKRDLRAWLGCPTPSDLYDDSIRKRLDGTCEWILERAEFRTWLSADAPGAAKLLWINGPAGFGKTILCAKLVEVISSAPQIPTAHFFLSSKSEGRDDPFLAIRWWLATMTFQSQAALDVVRKRRLAQHEQVATRATVIHLFREVVQTVPFCTFVLDGLDECTWVGGGLSSSDSVTRFLEDLRQAIDDTTARILVVSRNEPEIRQGLTRYSGFSEYKISLDDVCADNIAYSRSIVNNKLSNKDEPTRLSISQRMADRCHGQFQWLRMQEDFLRKGRNQKQLEKDIDETPAGLDRLYDRNWERIERLREVERTRAFSLLRWAAFSLRPLTVCEITEAVLINNDCDDLPVDELPDSVDDDYVESEILGLCGSLIEVRGTSSESSAGSRKIHIAHFSVKQYLLCKIPSQGAVLYANESLRASNEVIEGATLAKLCLRYVGFQKVWDGSLPDRIGMSSREYAAKYWYQHSDVSKTKDEALVEAMNALFDGRVQTWESWRRWFDVNGEDPQPEANETALPASPLYYASRLGLTGVVKYLVQHCKRDPNEMSTSGRVALEIACEKGNQEIARMLLEVGADVNLRGHRGRTPLYGASMNGHLELVRLVLQHEGSLTIENISGLTPLNVASDSGHFEVVKLLLDKGADIAVTDDDGWTPLNSASNNGHLEVVKLLLDKGADITVANKGGWTPLIAASDSGHFEVVKLLLDKGADITVANKDGWTPLNSASYSGHLEVVKLLLDKGADITVTSKGGWTPLYKASSKGHLEVVKLLLDKGADITVATKSGQTPLNAASYSGHLEVVKLLLDKGADITVADEGGRTPLNLASGSGHLEVVKLLLNKGADITRPSRVRADGHRSMKPQAKAIWR